MLHLSAARWAKSLASCLKRWQPPSFGNRVSSAADLTIIDGIAKSAVRALDGYSPQKTLCKDSKARGTGVERRYMLSVLDIISGMKPSRSM